MARFPKMRNVSIHARTRRATGRDGEANRHAVSIHARTRRATMPARRSLANKFQSTPARGGRRCRPSLRNGGFNPRPHAAGDAWVKCGNVPRSFNPRPHAAGDLAAKMYTRTGLEFQSTPARGGRQPSPGCSLGTRCFNPRPHAAGDRRHKRSRVVSCSIHARTRRATLAWCLS